MEVKHWLEDPYWTEALELLYRCWEEWVEIVIDLNTVVEAAFGEGSNMTSMLNEYCISFIITNIRYAIY